MTKKIINRCFSAVSAASTLQQQTATKLSPKEGGVKTKSTSYRKCLVSRTVRVPNELVGKVRALVAAYRTEQRSNPDTWN